MFRYEQAEIFGNTDYLENVRKNLGHRKELKKILSERAQTLRELAKLEERESKAEADKLYKRAELLEIEKRKMELEGKKGMSSNQIRRSVLLAHRALVLDETMHKKK